MTADECLAVWPSDAAFGHWCCLPEGHPGDHVCGGFRRSCAEIGPRAIWDVDDVGDPEPWALPMSVPDSRGGDVDEVRTADRPPDEAGQPPHRGS